MNIVVHDLKSPLNRIYGLPTVMEIQKRLTANMKEYIQFMKDSTRSGLDLITDLLDVNELEEGGRHKKESIDMAAWMENKIRTYQAADAKLITNKNENSVNNNVFSDASYLGRTLDNLITNAIKFSSSNTTITVACQIDGDTFLLKIKDHGPGFSMQDRPFLFQKFKKLTARPAGGESSNGLGLAIVKTLVDRLNDKIDLISETGKGSEFVIQIPVE